MIWRNKKAAACGLLCLGVLAAAVASGENGAVKDASESVKKHTGQETKNQTDGEQPARLIFWYDDEDYLPYLESAARKFNGETGAEVSFVLRTDLDYPAAVYDGTFHGEAVPDLFLLSAEQLDEFCRYGIVRDNAKEELYAECAENARRAATWNGVLKGYPLSYNVCLFAYKETYFGGEPDSLSSIIEYSNNNEPEEQVHYLLEWNVNDPFYDFLFVSKDVSFEDWKVSQSPSYFDENCAEELAFLEDAMVSFSIDTNSVSERSILRDMKNGATLCAVVDSDSIEEAHAYGYAVSPFPKLNQKLETKSCAVTDLIAVNEFSGNALAEAFAEYLTVDCLGELHGLTGHYPVKLSPGADALERTAYHVYEDAVNVPSFDGAAGFWIALKERVAACFAE